MTLEHINTISLYALCAWNLWMGWQMLLSNRKVLLANRRLLKLVDDSVERMKEADELLGTQQQELDRVRKAALFWYVQWLQQMGKR